MFISEHSMKQVAVLMPLMLKGHRDNFLGIMRYAKSHGPWRLYRLEGRPGEQQLHNLKKWGCDGIITGACTLAEATLLKRLKVPIVVFEPSATMREKGHPLAHCLCTVYDSAATGVMAADYFLERHYKNFAFVGEVHEVYWSRQREESFRRRITACGGNYSIYPGVCSQEQMDWAEEQASMQHWLKSLPKPVALFAAMDGRARQVLDACLGAGITVPNDVAVLGVDDDELICEATLPSLSSIQTNGEQSGFAMAQKLDALMHGKRVKRGIIKGMPVRVTTRASTDITAIKNPFIARALEIIWREAAYKPLLVSDVVEALGVSRRFIEMHFKTALGRTIMEEIRRVKLERVCSLLVETNLTIGEITQQCGFARESHLASLFRKRFGSSMREYRTERFGYKPTLR